MNRLSLWCSPLTPALLTTFLAIVAASAGCAGATHGQQANAPNAGNAVSVPTTYVTPLDAGTLQQRFDSAVGMLAAGKFKDAAAQFDLIAQFEPQGRLAAASLFNAGFAYEQCNDRSTAMARYASVVRQFPQGTEAGSALLRGTRVLSWMEDWSQLATFADMLLARTDLAPIERVEALGARALGLVEQGQDDPALAAVSKARTLIEDNGWGDSGPPPLAAAQVFFSLGEVRRMQGERIVFSPTPANFGEVLERRCQALLDAQEAYSQAMRARDAHWAAMAGYRIGQLYQQLHLDVMSIAPPATAKTDEQKALFFGAMQLRYRVLIEKGLKMINATLEMAEKTKENSVWVNRAREAKRDLEKTLRGTQDVLAKLPYREEDLQRALAGLAAPKVAPEATKPAP